MKSSFAAVSAVSGSRSARSFFTLTMSARLKNAAARLVLAPLGGVETREPIERDVGATRGNLRHEPAEGRALGRDAAANHDEVLRHRAAVHLAEAALETDRGDVVLAAAVRTAAHLDVERRRQINQGRIRAHVVGEVLAEAP